MRWAAAFRKHCTCSSCDKRLMKVFHTAPLDDAVHAGQGAPAAPCGAGTSRGAYPSVVDSPRSARYAATARVRTMRAGMLCHPPGITTIAPAALKEACMRPAAKVLPPVSMRRVPIRYRRNGAASRIRLQSTRASCQVVPCQPFTSEGQRQVHQKERNSGQQRPDEKPAGSHQPALNESTPGRLLPKVAGDRAEDQVQQ